MTMMAGKGHDDNDGDNANSYDDDKNNDDDNDDADEGGGDDHDDNEEHDDYDNHMLMMIQLNSMQSVTESMNKSLGGIIFSFVSNIHIFSVSI